jgi:hypothetical protein
LARVPGRALLGNKLQASQLKRRSLPGATPLRAPLKDLIGGEEGSQAMEHFTYEYDVAVTRGSTSFKTKIETDIPPEWPRVLYPEEVNGRFVKLSTEELMKFFDGAWFMYFEDRT